MADIVGDVSGGATPQPYAIGLLSADGRWRWDGTNWQPVQIRLQSKDVLVKLAAYAALTSSAVTLLSVVVTLIFTAMLKDPSNQYLAPMFQSIRAIAVGIAWGLLSLVAIGLYRFARPPSVTSTIGLIFAAVGAGVVVLSELLVVVAAAGGPDLVSSLATLGGELAIGVWLLWTNWDLEKRRLLPKGLTQTGTLFGVGVLILSGGLVLSTRVTVAGLIATLGFLVWPSWLGLVLLRPPIGGSPSPRVPARSLTDRLNSIRAPWWVFASGMIAALVVIGVFAWWRFHS